MIGGRSALRRLRREPGLSFAVIATLALGIGASTALFVYFAAFLVPMLPARDPARLVQIHFGSEDDPLALSSFADYRAAAESGRFEEVAANRVAGATVAVRDQTLLARGQGVTASSFSIFAARPALGRLLDESDERAPGTRPVMVSHRLWWTLLRSDPAAIGRDLTLNGTPFTVVGVTERGFHGVGFASEWLVPIAEIDRLTGVERLDDPNAKFLTAWGLVPPGSGSKARTESALAATRLLRGLLFGVVPIDPATFLVVPELLAAAVLVASWIPARRAALVDPEENLRTL